MLADTHHIAHGTTSSLNALVTGNVPPVGFLTTRGHRDSIYIMNVEGRYLGSSPDELQNVLGQSKSHGLLPKKHALEVTERIDRDGNVIVPLDEDQARQAIRTLAGRRHRARSRSPCSGRSATRPTSGGIRELVHEIDPDVFVPCRSEVSPRIREFARNATTIMSTQIGPGLRDYLGALEAELREPRDSPARCWSCRATAARSPPREAPATAISTVGSVLTGGVVGSVSLGEQLGHRNIISTDVGGTTFLVGLIVDGEPVRATTTIINHHPINVPTLKVHAIGSGGGAIAWLDAGGNLQVGPHSAQAVPGPACYGQGGTEPTNTDANLVLGILPERGLLGGRKPLDVDARREAIRDPHRRAARPLRRGRGRRDLRGAERADRRPAPQDRRRGRPRPARLRPLRLRRCRPRPLRGLRRRGGRPPRWSCPWARWRRRSPPTGWPRPTSSSPRSCPTRRRCRSTRSGWTKNFADLEAQVREALDRQGVQYSSVELDREIDMRYTMQLAELAVAGAERRRSTTAVIGQRRTGLRAAVRRALRRGHRLQRGRHPGHHLPGPRHRRPAVLAHAARTGARGQRGPRRRPARQPSGQPRRRRRLRRHRRLRLPQACAPVTSWTGPAVIEVPTTTVVVPARHAPARSTASATSPSSPVRSPPDDHADPRLRAVQQPAGRARTQLASAIPASLPLHTVTQEQIDGLDPLTYEVIRHRLWSVTDEMGEALKRMSGSPIVTDANDFDFAIGDELGQEVQVGLYNTMLVGAVDLAIYWTLRTAPPTPASPRATCSCATTPGSAAACTRTT